MSTYKQVLKRYNVEFEEVVLTEDHALALEDQTRRSIIVNLKDQKKGLSKAALDETIKAATRQFEDYTIYHCPEGLFIEGK